MEETKQKQKLFGYEPDSDYEESWNDFLAEIRTILKNETAFYVEGTNMGWQHLSGFTTIETSDPQRFMSAILPKTSDLTIEVYKSAKPGAMCDMTVYHHDAPIGEYRTVYSMKKARRLKIYTENS